MLFYGLEKGIAKKAPATSELSRNTIHFWLSIVGVGLYSILLGFLLGRTDDLTSIVLFTVAMGLHFLAISARLLEMHRDAYQSVGRWILSTSFLVGWGVSAVLDIPPPLFAVLISFVAGGAVLLVIQDEFAEPQGGSFPAFLLAVLGYGALRIAL